MAVLSLFYLLAAGARFELAHTGVWPRGQDLNLRIGRAYHALTTWQPSRKSCALPLGEPAKNKTQYNTIALPFELFAKCSQNRT